MAVSQVIRVTSPTGTRDHADDRPPALARAPSRAPATDRPPALARAPSHVLTADRPPALTRPPHVS